MISPTRRLAVSSAKRASRSRFQAYSSRSGVNSIEDEEVTKLNELLNKFKDPSSHYHIPPGTHGPSHEEDHTTSRHPSSPSSSNAPSSSSSSSSSSLLSSTSTSTTTLISRSGLKGEKDEYKQSRLVAIKMFEADGYDTNEKGILEWPVAWGDCDMFQHVNNVRYVRWIETARIRYAESLDLPSGQVAGMLSGKGTGFILKDVYLKYIRPVTWPDTVMIASRAHEIQPSKSSFKLKHAIWSLKDKRLAAIGDSTMIMYDYDNLRKGVMMDEFRQALEDRTPSRPA